MIVVTAPAQVRERAIEGPPALVVEILSPTSERRDRGVKARRYAELGVRATGSSISRLVRSNVTPGAKARTSLVASARGEERLVAPAWPELSVDLAALWR